MSIASDKIVNLQDAKVLYDDLRGRIKDNSVVEVLDTPADIQSFSDAARFPMELKVGIDTVQDLHGYDHPWVGGAGKNKLKYPYATDTRTAYGITETFNSDGTIVLDGTCTGELQTRLQDDRSGYDFYIAPGTYILSGMDANQSAYIYVSLTKNGSYVAQDIATTKNGAYTFTIDSNVDYDNVRVAFYIATGQVFSNKKIEPMIRLSTESDSTFAPYTNIAPITGWTGAKVTATGKNLFDKNNVTNQYVAADGTVSNSTSGKLSGFIKLKDGKCIATAKRIGTATISSDSALRIICYDENKAFISRVLSQITATIGATVSVTINDTSVKYVRLNVFIESEDIDTAQLELGTTATDYEPFGNTYDVSFPTSTGTVYGGELTIHSDGSGELMVDRVGVNMGTLEWNYNSTYTRFTYNITGTKTPPNNNTIVQGLISSCYATDTSNNTAAKNGAIGISTSGTLQVSDHRYTTKSELQTALDGQIAVYPLASPVSIQLTPGQVFALLGSNNVWANCGQINYLEYVRDTVGEVIPNRFDGIEQDIVDTNTYEKTISEANAIQTFEDGAEWPMGMQIAVDPVQDLHGYDHPWPGGSSKNLLPMNATLPVSSNGIRYNLKYDGTIDARGTATADAYVYVDFTSETLGTSGDLSFIGAPSGGASTYHAYVWDKTNNQRAKQWDGTTNCENAYGSGFKKVKILENVQYTFVCRVMSGVSVTNVVFTPMICLGTETDATFVPYENICPITGWNETTVNVNGANLFDPNVTGYTYPYTMRGITVSNDNGVITLNGTVESPEFFYPQNHMLYKKVILPSTTYVFTTGHVDSQMEIQVYYNVMLNSGTTSNWKLMKSGVGKGELEFTAPPEFNSIWIRIKYSTGVVLNNVKLYPMIRLATDVDPTFEPYAGKAYTVSFPSNAGTVYGGELTVNKDGTGTLVVDRVGKELPLTGWDTSLNWNTMLHQALALGGLVDASRDDLVLCSHAKSVTNNHMYYSRSDTNPEPKISKGMGGQIRIRMLSVATTPEEYLAYFTAQKNAGTPITIAYLLETPITYYMTPGQVFSLLNKNNVWADCGPINRLDYVRNVISKAIPERFSVIEKELTKINNKVGVVYGFHIDSNESDPDAAVTYVADAVGMIPAKMDFTNNRFSYGSWEDAFFMPRPCMLKYDGTVDYYLDPNDYSKKANGTASDVANTTYGGNAMMEWGRDGKKIWYTIVPDSGDETSATVYIADHQVDDRFHAWPFINTEGKMADHFYTPCYFGTVIDGKIRSLSGQSGANRSKGYTAAQERELVKANNPSGVDIWDMESWSETILIQLILILMGKNLNGQNVFGFGLANGGSDTNNNGFVSGQHDNKGLFYGTSYGTITVNENAVKVLGMENWWGFSWRRILGLVLVNDVYKTKLCYGEADGSATNDYLTSANATDYAGYVEQGAVATGTSGSFVSKMRFNRGMLLPSTVSGTASTFFCDTITFNTEMRFAGRGGASTSATGCGPFALAINNPPSLAYWSFGASPSCRPLT